MIKRRRDDKEAALVKSLQEQVEFLRSELRTRAEELQRRDAVLMQMVQSSSQLNLGTGSGAPSEVQRDQSISKDVPSAGKEENPLTQRLL